MGLFERILVPVDGSHYSLDAACVASRLARIHSSELRVFHVIDEWLLDQLSRFSRKDRETVRLELISNARTFLGDIRCGPHQEIVSTSEIIIKEGVPHEIILAEASAWSADLIVMGKLGRRGISHILIGSVAQHVIEFSEVPVLIVK